MLEHLRNINLMKIIRSKILQPENVWFISDTHFGDKKILEYDERPFKNINEHDKQLIERWNDVIKERDFVFHLGDFSIQDFDYMKHIVNVLYGKIILVKGNYDGYILNIHDDAKNLFFDVIDLSRIAIYDLDQPLNAQSIVLCHYPIEDWDGKYRGSWHFHGHTHGRSILSQKNWDTKGQGYNISKYNKPVWPRFNISVHNTDYSPISYNKLKTIYNEAIKKHI